MPRQQHQVGTLGDGINTRAEILEFIDKHTMLMHTPDEATHDFGGCMVNVLCDGNLKGEFLELARNRMRFSQYNGEAYKITVTSKTPCSIIDVREWIGSDHCSYEQACGFMALVKHFGLGEITREPNHLSVTFNEQDALEISGRHVSALFQQQEQQQKNGGVKVTYTSRYF